MDGVGVVIGWAGLEPACERQHVSQALEEVMGDYLREEHFTWREQPVQNF